MTKCKKCKNIIRGDCMLTTGVCVFCHYGIIDWDSNGQLVTIDEATIKEIKIVASRAMPDYKEALRRAVNYYFDRPYACDIPVKRGTSIFTWYAGNILREFDLKDYRKWQRGEPIE